MNTIERAMEYASIAHAEINQYQHSYSLPYIVHPFEVMKRLATWGINDEDVLAAAALHDVVEDTKRTIEDVKRAFGGNIARLVGLLTRPDEDSLNFLQKFNYLKLFATKDFDAVIVKIADRWANVLDYHSIKKKRKYAAKYALQCHPVFKTFIDQYALYDKYPNYVAEGVIESLEQIEKIVKTHYNENYNLRETTVDEAEKMLT